MRISARAQVRFLRYIKQWGKKVVFVVNKVDIFDRSSDVDEVVDFVAGNARTLLAVDSAQVFPVSARMALAAKVDAGAPESRGLLGEDAEALRRLEGDRRWRRSRFPRLEQFMLDFLTGVHGMRTPLCRSAMHKVHVSIGFYFVPARIAGVPECSLTRNSENVFAYTPQRACRIRFWQGRRGGQWRSRRRREHAP